MQYVNLDNRELVMERQNNQPRTSYFGSLSFNNEPSPNNLVLIRKGVGLSVVFLLVALGLIFGATYAAESLRNSLGTMNLKYAVVGSAGLLIILSLLAYVGFIAGNTKSMILAPEILAPLSLAAQVVNYFALGSLWKRELMLFVVGVFVCLNIFIVVTLRISQNKEEPQLRKRVLYVMAFSALLLIGGVAILETQFKPTILELCTVVGIVIWGFLYDFAIFTNTLFKSRKESWMTVLGLATHFSMNLFFVAGIAEIAFVI